MPKDLCKEENSAAQEVVQEVTKSRWEKWLNRFRVRLPLLLLGALLVLADPVWNPWGVPFLLLGEGLRTWAVGYIYKDRELATQGPYGFCRHPLYLGTFLSSIGMCLLVGNWIVAIVFGVVFAAVYRPTIRHEERYLSKVYKEAYREYAAKVPPFFPRLRATGDGTAGRWSFRRLIRNEEHLTWIALVVFILLMLAKQQML